VGDFIEVFANNIIPIFLVAAMGYGLRAGLKVDKKPLSTASFYVLSPALVFTALVNSGLPGEELLRLSIFTIIVTLAMGLVGLIMGWVLKLPRVEIAALLMVLMFVNGGNYGLTLNELRYGSEGLARASVYFVVGTMILFTLGIFIASMGRTSWKESLLRLVRLPAFYAVVLGIIVYSLDYAVPTPIMRGLEITAAGAIPVMLLVLGMQIADLRSLERIKLAVPASLVRLLVAPVIAVLIAALLNLDGLARSTSIIEASMPTAVLTTIIATEFNLRPAFVTSTVVLSTLLSAFTLPLVITLLGL
jgi:predicted permease